MKQLSAPIIASRTVAGLQQIVVGAPALAQTLQPGQFMAVRIAPDGAFDPLLRLSVPVAGIDRGAGTVTTLFEVEGKDRQLLASRSVGDSLDLLGPLGNQWPVPREARNLLLIGTVTTAASLLALMEEALRQQRAVTLLLGGAIGPSLPASFIPPAVEYNLGRGVDPVAAALELLDPALIQWADTLCSTLPPPSWPDLDMRVRRTRIHYDRNFAFVASLPPLPCAVGVCGACAISLGRKQRLVCVHGPVFQLAMINDQ